MNSTTTTPSLTFEPSFDSPSDWYKQTAKDLCNDKSNDKRVKNFDANDLYTQREQAILGEEKRCMDERSAGATAYQKDEVLGQWLERWSKEMEAQVATEEDDILFAFYGHTETIPMRDQQTTKDGRVRPKEKRM